MMYIIMLLYNAFCTICIALELIKINYHQILQQPHRCVGVRCTEISIKLTDYILCTLRITEKTAATFLCRDVPTPRLVIIIIQSRRVLSVLETITVLYWTGTFSIIIQCNTFDGHLNSVTIQYSHDVYHNLR